MPNSISGTIWNNIPRDFKLLKNLPEETLNKAQFQYRQCWPPEMRPFYFGPVAESPDRNPTAFLTEYPAVILSNKKRPLRDIPWLVGTNENEGATFYAGVVMENPKLLEKLNKEWDTIVPVAFDYGGFSLKKEEKQNISSKIRQFYFGYETELITKEQYGKNLTNLFGDQLATHSIYKAAVETAQRNESGPVYLYQYAYPGPLSVMGLGFNLKGEETKMVAHVDDLHHLFDLSDELFPGTSNAIKEDSEFFKNFVRLWLSFAVHGEPNHVWGSGLSNGLKWRSLSKKDVECENFPMQWFRINGNLTGYLKDDPYKEQMQFWNGLFEEYFTPMLTPKKLVCHQPSNKVN